MKYTITITPESVMRQLNEKYDENFTIDQIQENWDSITDYIDNLVCNGGLNDYIWEDFSIVSEEWGIELFNS